MSRLKLVALDDEDLSVISAHCQDAVLKGGDLQFLRAEKRFVVPMNRFVWEGNPDRGAKHERRRAVLHFERVERARQQGIDRNNVDQVLSLLALTFIPGEAPAGTIEIAFSAGATIHLDVECVECQLADMAAAWETSSRPVHED